MVQKTASLAPEATPSRTPRPSPVSTAFPDAASAPRMRKSRVPVMVLAALFMVGVAIGFYIHLGPSHLQAATQPAALLPTNTLASASDGPTAAPLETNPTDPVIAAVKPAKSTNDFKISDLAVERPKGTKGSKLTYVSGVVENLSDMQRFGVKIELELLDQRGAKIDSTSDYCDALGPHQTWPFRAQAHDPRSVQARVASIKEDN